MANTSSRTLRLLSLLQTHRYWPGVELRSGSRSRSAHSAATSTGCADSLDWPAMALGAVGADFTVLTPPELLDHVHDWGERFSRATARDASAIRARR